MSVQIPSKMIFDNLRHGSPAPESNCSQLNAMSEAVGSKNKAKNVRSKRMELRRLRSISKEKHDEGVYPTEECSSNKRRNVSNSDEYKQPTRTQLIPMLYMPFDELANHDVVMAGTSGTAEDEEDARPGNGVACSSHGSISVIGRRREMEDAVAVAPGFLTIGSKAYDFFGVYDGHGGSRVAEACREMMHVVVAGMVKEETEEEVDWEKVMVAGFRKMDEEVNKIGGAAVATVGSTAVVAVVGEDEVVVANCGDSRAVLYRGGVAMPLSDDHKPDRPDELERIEVSGGKVINWNGQRVLGVLATSRSIGDRYLKPYVITEPEVRITNRTDADEFLILATDGLWDVITNDLACQVVKRCLDGRMRTVSQTRSDDPPYESRAMEATAVLAELAMARGSRDNISVVVVELKRSTVRDSGQVTGISS